MKVVRRKEAGVGQTIAEQALTLCERIGYQYAAVVDVPISQIGSAAGRQIADRVLRKRVAEIQIDRQQLPLFQRLKEQSSLS